MLHPPRCHHHPPTAVATPIVVWLLLLLTVFFAISLVSWWSLLSSRDVMVMLLLLSCRSVHLTQCCGRLIGVRTNLGGLPCCCSCGGGAIVVRWRWLRVCYALPLSHLLVVIAIVTFLTAAGFGGLRVLFQGSVMVSSMRGKGTLVCKRVVAVS
ncbi:hypothetical protein EDB85DRAFT_2024417 [Lactarius pseudohatsudake]|nr:hypothetical protein EDB85DRAFT_2024417 [Lactarius pseudohatsudake]